MSKKRSKSRATGEQYHKTQAGGQASAGSSLFWEPANGGEKIAYEKDGMGRVGLGSRNRGLPFLPWPGSFTHLKPTHVTEASA